MNPSTDIKQTRYYHVPTKQTYYSNGASGLVSEDNDSPIPLWLVEGSQDWVKLNNKSEHCNDCVNDDNSQMCKLCVDGSHQTLGQLRIV